MSHDDGVYLRWLLNTVLYAVVSAGGAALLATVGGYGFAKFQFPGKRSRSPVLGSIMVPSTALAIPTYLLFAGSASSTRARGHPAVAGEPARPLPDACLRRDAVPDTLLDAARIDGASELQIFSGIASGC